MTKGRQAAACAEARAPSEKPKEVLAPGPSASEEGPGPQAACPRQFGLLPSVGSWLHAPPEAFAHPKSGPNKVESEDMVEKNITSDSEASTDAGGTSAADACSAASTRSPEPALEPDACEMGLGGAAEPQRYEALRVVGTGVYGTVFLARDPETNDMVAIKRQRFDDDQSDGVPAHIIREVSLLRDFVHPNIVQLKDLQMFGPAEIGLVFEYVPDDLHQVLRGHRREGTQLPMEEVLKYSQNLLDGIHACHVRLVIHRDLKPQNVLVHPVDGLKICDFGLSRVFSLPVKSCYTPQVITLWYRCPELLLGHPSYGPEVDIWSAGCILAEIATAYPIFPGDSEIGTIFKIMQLLGSPTEATWPGFESLPLWSNSYPSWPPTCLKAIRDQRPELGDAGMDLVCSLLAMNPAARPTSRRARAHAFCKRAH